MSGGPDLGRGELADRLNEFRQHHDSFRSALLPAGEDAGAAILPPANEFLARCQIALPIPNYLRFGIELPGVMV